MSLFKWPFPSETFTQLQLISVGFLHAIWAQSLNSFLYVFFKTRFQNQSAVVNFVQSHVSFKLNIGFL